LYNHGTPRLIGGITKMLELETPRGLWYSMYATRELEVSWAIAEGRLYPAVENWDIDAWLSQEEWSEEGD
jgi:hypothetical protein